MQQIARDGVLETTFIFRGSERDDVRMRIHALRRAAGPASTAAAPFALAHLGRSTRPEQFVFGRGIGPRRSPQWERKGGLCLDVAASPLGPPSSGSAVGRAAGGEDGHREPGSGSGSLLWRAILLEPLSTARGGRKCERDERMLRRAYTIATPTSARVSLSTDAATTTRPVQRRSRRVRYHRGSGDGGGQGRSARTSFAKGRRPSAHVRSPLQA